MREKVIGNGRTLLQEFPFPTPMLRTPMFLTLSLRRAAELHSPVDHRHRLDAKVLVPVLPSVATPGPLPKEEHHHHLRISWEVRVPLSLQRPGGRLLRVLHPAIRVPTWPIRGKCGTKLCECG